jgi:hypothetical protein
MRLRVGLRRLGGRRALLVDLVGVVGAHAAAPDGDRVDAAAAPARRYFFLGA